MGNAGRVLMIPRGDYNSGTQYSPLDVVLYESDSYVCKQLSTGNAPTNTTYWQKLTDVGELKEALTDEAKTRSALGAKNLLPCTLKALKDCNTSGTWSGNAYTFRGVTFTVNTDSKGNVTSIDTSGTASNNITFALAFSTYTNIENMGLELNVPYILSGCPNGGSNNTYNVRYDSGGAWSYPINNGESVDFTFTSATNTYKPMIYIGDGTNVDGKVFKPMIRLATDSDPTYQPYAMTNKELTDNKADKSDLASISITGTTNNTGATITSGRYFYLNGALVKAKADIANGATLTANTNYEAVTAGGLNEIEAEIGSLTDNTTTIHENTLMSALKTNYNYVMDDCSVFSGYLAMCLVIKRTANTGVQIAFKSSNSADVYSGYMAYRLAYNDTWSNWAVVTATSAS